MQGDASDYVYVVTSTPVVTGADGRPVHVCGKPDAPRIAAIPMETFKSGMAGFIRSVRSEVAGIESRADSYQIDWLEIGSSIGADGEVSLLGNAVSLETAASIKRTLRGQAGTTTEPGRCQGSPARRHIQTCFAGPAYPGLAFPAEFPMLW
jgi:hypothetical protein